MGQAPTLLNPRQGKPLRLGASRLRPDAPGTGDEHSSWSLTAWVPSAKTPMKVVMTFNHEQTDWPGRAGLEGSLSRVSGNYHARSLAGTMQLPSGRTYASGRLTRQDRGVHAASIDLLNGDLVSESAPCVIRPVKRRERRAPAALQLHRSGLGGKDS
jgi:hypothetical protein